MYAFVHIEKTGGTTINQILRRSFGTRHCDVRLPLAKRGHEDFDHRTPIDAADLRRVQRVYRQLKCIGGHNVKAYSALAAACPDIEFFTVLRDPAARFRSHFLNRADGHTPAHFDRWGSAAWVQNWQTKMIAGEPNGEKAIELLAARFGFVGLTERFDESLVLLGSWMGEPSFRAEYRRQNQLRDKQRPRDVARQQIDMSYLDSDSARARIAEANAEDQKVYDFVTQTIYPRQVTAHPGNLASDVDALRQRNRAIEKFREPLPSSLFRNYVYKPLLHCYVC